MRGWFQYHRLHQGAETRPRAVGKASDTGLALSVFWEGRLVPDTVVQDLLCFSELDTPKKCENANVAVRWKERVHGQLFLDSSFEHISNNKLQISLGPSFEQWLKTEDKKKSFKHVAIPLKTYVDIYSSCFSTLFHMF